MNCNVNSDEAQYNRRRFLRHVSYGAAGLAAVPLISSGCSGGLKSVPRQGKIYSRQAGESRVSLATGNNRRNLVRDSLKPFENEVAQNIKGKKVLIKVNANRPGDLIVHTDADAVRGVLDFLKPIHEGEVVIGESISGTDNMMANYKFHGYLDIRDEFDVSFLDLNNDNISHYWILNARLYPEKIGILNRFIDPDWYVISVTPLKTHNCVVATLSLKNIVMGAPQKIPARNINFKSRMHATNSKNKTPIMINLNIFKIAHAVRPDLAVVDGFVGAEGDGPNICDPVDHRVVMAGTDCIAVDRLGVELMGIDYEKVGYLQWCSDAGLGQGDLDKIKVIGADYRPLIKTYKLHKNIDWQYEWMDEIAIPNRNRVNW